MAIDWSTVSTIVGSFILGGLITPWIVESRNRNQARETLLLQMLNSWLLPANPEYQAAIASIEVVFAKKQKVIRRRDTLVSFLSNQQEQQKLGSKYEGAVRERQAELIEEMAAVVGKAISKEQLLRSAYISTGFMEREQINLLALEAWPRIADALEQSNALNRQILRHLENDGGEG